MIKIGALWSSTDSKGNKYLAGKMGDARLVVFKNTYKEKDSQPDFQVYLAENKKREEKAEPKQVSFEDDEIPF